jgi:rare lipoprotein A
MMPMLPAGREGAVRSGHPAWENAADLCASSRTAAAATCDFRIAGGDAPRRDLAIFNEDRRPVAAIMAVMALGGTKGRTRAVLLALLALALCPWPAAADPGEDAPHAQGAFFEQTGRASYYGKKHDGDATADGSSFDRTAFTAAHPTLPFGTVVEVTNLANGRSVKVRISDRGPHVLGRIIDLSAAAARELGMLRRGLARVRISALLSDKP